MSQRGQQGFSSGRLDRDPSSTSSLAKADNADNVSALSRSLEMFRTPPRSASFFSTSAVGPLNGELTCISEEILMDNILDEYADEMISSCNKEEKYLMYSEFENNVNKLALSASKDPAIAKESWMLGIRGMNSILNPNSRRLHGSTVNTFNGITMVQREPLPSTSSTSSSVTSSASGPSGHTTTGGLGSSSGNSSTNKLCTCSSKKEEDNQRL